MTTALDIITDAMRECRILGRTEVPTSDEANTALRKMNSMLSSWSNDSMMLYARVWENFPLVAGTGSYSIGASQTFNTVRPILVASAYTRNVTTDAPLTVKSDEDYSAIVNKSNQGLPEVLNLDGGFPYGTIRLYPVPAIAYTLYMLNEKQLSTFTLNQTVSLPPGWERALTFNLPAEIAGSFGVEVPASVAGIAATSKALIQKSIMKNRSFDAMPQRVAAGNILTGWN